MEVELSEWAMNKVKEHLTRAINLAHTPVEAIMFGHCFLMALIPIVEGKQFYELVNLKEELVNNFKPEDVKNVQS